MTVRVPAFVQRVLSALLVLAFAAPLAAQPAQAVEGHVIDLTGAPVAGARVELVVAGRDAQRRRRLRRTVPVELRPGRHVQGHGLARRAGAGVH